MYVLRKQMPFMAPNTPFYKAQTARPHTASGTFQMYRAKKFRYWLPAFIANLRFKGEIHKVHPALC